MEQVETFIIHPGLTVFSTIAVLRNKGQAE